MNSEDRLLCTLPKKRTGLRTKLLSEWPMWRIGLTGLLLYITIVELISLAEYYLSSQGEPWIRATDSSTVTWLDFLYFNFVSALSIGYGDYIPANGLARLTAVIEAFLGMATSGITIAALTAKFLSPPQDAIVFSRYAYYCTEQESFLVIYLNTSKSRLVNAENATYFKLGRDWTTYPPAKSPFITRAVQTFFVERVPEKRLVQQLDEDHDALRFALSGQLGVASVNVAIEYKPTDIIVLKNRNILVNRPEFWDPDLGSPELEKMFHYRPVGARTLSEYVHIARKLQKNEISGVDNPV